MSIRLTDVYKAYGGRAVISGLTLAFGGGITCLFGPSGCGKTTLLRLIAGLEKPDAGTIDAPRRISMCFQEDRLLPWQSAAANVAFGAPGCDAPAMLAELGISAEDAKKRPAELSGGMNRRVALARALARRAELYLLDEPFSGLDEDAKKAAFAAVSRHTAEKAVIWITHDIEEAYALSDDIIRFSGPPLFIAE